MYNINSLPLLSICLPIYNRKQVFQYTFERLLYQLNQENEINIEVIISLNPCNDGKEDMFQYVKKYAHYKFIKIYKNNTNVGGQENLLRAIEKATGKYIWVIGDDDLVLPGTLCHVINILKGYKDVTWVFLNYARLKGSPDCLQSKLISISPYQGDGGYYSNGKQAAIQIHKKIDSAMLFSSSNIYLREITSRIININGRKNMCNGLAFVLESAAHGGVYVIKEPCIIAGGEITWKKEKKQVYLKYYNDAILCVSQLSFTTAEAISLIRYRIKHRALSLLPQCILLCLKHDDLGKSVYFRLLHLFPITVLFQTVFSPFIIIFLIFRHFYYIMKGRLSCIRYSKSSLCNEDICKYI